MKKIISFLLTFIFLSGIIMFTAGCFDETEKANKLVDKANKHILKSNISEKEIQKKFDEIESLPGSDEEFKDTLKFSRELEEMTKNQEKEIQSSISAFKQAKGLDISDEYKKYLDMEVKASEAKSDSTKAMTELAELFIDLFEKGVKGTITDKDIEDFGKKAEQLTNKGEKLENEIEELFEKAEKYYKEQDLG